jgi:hypothetical protein
VASVTVTSSGIVLPPAPVPVLSGLTISPTSFLPASRGASIARAKHVTGATVSYRDSVQATTTFTVERSEPGVRRGAACVAPSRRRGKAAKRCTRTVVMWPFTHADQLGANRFTFTGRGGRSDRPLAAGSYVLVAVARDAIGRSQPVRATFTILK